MDGGVRFVRLPSLSLLLGWPDDLSLTGTSGSRVEVSLQRLQTSSSVVRSSVCLQRHFVFFAEHLSHVKRLEEDLQRLLCPLPILRKRAYKLKSCVSFCYISVRNHHSEFNICHQVYFILIHLSVGTRCFVYFKIFFSDIRSSWN